MSLHLRTDDTGIATLTLDRPDDGPNVVDDGFLDALDAALESLAGTPALRGAIVTSAKRDFLVGADIDAIGALDDPGAAMALATRFRSLLRRLETLGIPVVAAIHGRALGGGLELALACHHRVATGHATTRLGMPEVRLGLMPGGGGTQRLPRLVGERTALELLLEGAELDARTAVRRGVVDALAEDTDDADLQARAWINDHPDARQPWDRDAPARPGGDPWGPDARRLWALAPASLHRRRAGRGPAGLDILSAVFEGTRLDLDAGGRVESRYFAHCVTGRAAKNTIRVLWHELGAVHRAEARPAGYRPGRFATVGVLGAGLMGSGIAHVAARAGLAVRVKDVDRAHAERALEHARRRWTREIESGRAGEAERDAALARLTVIDAESELADCDLVIEAVSEDRALKERVIAAAEAAVSPEAIIASNTSTLPIGSLAGACTRPERFLGLHFFSPVEHMPLLEIIPGRATGDAALAHAFDFAARIGKTPIRVNDARGFFTSRVFAAYVLEGAALLGEGQPPALIEHAATGAGMPLGPLALTDEVGLGLVLAILDQARHDADSGWTGVGHPGEAVLRTVAEAHGRTGKRAGAGFHDYPPEGGRLPWPGLAELFPRVATPAPAAAIAERLMLAQANTAARAFEDGIVERVADADVASVLGWGFPAAAGGVLGYIDDLGPARVAARLTELAADHGERFAPAAIIEEKAAAGTTFG